MEESNGRMINCLLEVKDGQVFLTAEVDAGKLAFNRYIGSRGAQVASNSDGPDAVGFDTYLGGPFTVSFSLQLKRDRWVASTEVFHDFQSCPVEPS